MFECRSAAVGFRGKSFSCFPRWRWIGTFIRSLLSDSFRTKVFGDFSPKIFVRNYYFFFFLQQICKWTGQNVQNWTLTKKSGYKRRERFVRIQAIVKYKVQLKSSCIMCSFLHPVVHKDSENKFFNKIIISHFCSCFNKIYVLSIL